VVSILKTRDSIFVPSLYEYDLTDRGMVIHETTDSVDRILAAGDESGQTPEREG
jgi:hypothetical protein